MIMIVQYSTIQYYLYEHLVEYCTVDCVHFTWPSLPVQVVDHTVYIMYRYLLIVIYY